MDALRNVKLSASEDELLATVRDIINETDIDIDDTRSLAAGMARTWAWFLRDVSLLSSVILTRLRIRRSGFIRASRCRSLVSTG